MSNKLNIHEIPKEKAKIVFDRIISIIEKYHRDQAHQSRVIDFNPINIFGIKELYFSGYTGYEAQPSQNVR